jgi:hypothetical protein
VTTTEIIVGGKRWPCAANVRTWIETGFHFVGRLRTETRWIINHWTAAENSAPQTFENMRTRGVSVHFICDQLGDIYQCADADARLAHAQENGGNTFGVGIEIINRGHGNAPAKSFVRTPRTERIHGHEITYGEFFPAQIASVIALNRALCQAYGLPLRCPVKNGEIYATVLPLKYLSTYRGCMGHLNLDEGKPDPGLDLLERIHAAGLVANA